MRVFFAFGIVSWLLVVYGFIPAIRYDLFFRWFVGPLLLFFSAYYLLSFIQNLFYKRFDLTKHFACVENFWASQKDGGGKKGEPSVDVFLPICGEELSVLRNTWQHVAALPYVNKKVYVLDDTKDQDSRKEQEVMAKQYGFEYLSRPDRGYMKKAGNIRYGFERSSGEFIVILDADCAPHPDFIRELLPYMEHASNDDSGKRIGIVQSPQYFDMGKKIKREQPLAYGAAHSQEAFYRIIEVARDRLDATICCGSNAIYRREALAQIGGASLQEHSEDAHTGFDLQALGWTVRYVPVILGIGTCPNDPHAYFHQQHTWCTGSLFPFMGRKFWKAQVSWKTKLSYITGFLYYFHHPLTLLFSFQLFWTLFFYNDYINLAGAIIFLPYMIWGFAYMLAFPISRFGRGAFYSYFIQLYSCSHSIVAAIFKSNTTRVATNSKQPGASRAFKQATFSAIIYLLAYTALIMFMAYSGKLHPLNYNYLTIQFWVLYNTILSTSLVVLLLRTYFRKR
ncbi:MAG TPA: cellulose synthase catalytic subunit [Candidatus Paceibacterota bacterium]